MMRRALAEGLAEALGPPRRQHQLDLFLHTVVQDVDGRPVELGQAVTLHPEGAPGTLAAIEGRYWRGGWRVVVELDDGGPRSVRGAHQIRAG